MLKTKSITYKILPFFRFKQIFYNVKKKQKNMCLRIILSNYPNLETCYDYHFSLFIRYFFDKFLFVDTFLLKILSMHFLVAPIKWRYLCALELVILDISCYMAIMRTFKDQLWFLFSCSTFWKLKTCNFTM